MTNVFLTAGPDGSFRFGFFSLTIPAEMRPVLIGENNRITYEPLAEWLQQAEQAFARGTIDIYGLNSKNGNAGTKYTDPKNLKSFGAEVNLVTRDGIQHGRSLDLGGTPTEMIFLAINKKGVTPDMHYPLFRRAMLGVPNEKAIFPLHGIMQTDAEGSPATLSAFDPQIQSLLERHGLKMVTDHFLLVNPSCAASLCEEMRTSIAIIDMDPDKFDALATDLASLTFSYGRTASLVSKDVFDAEVDQGLVSAELVLPRNYVEAVLARREIEVLKAALAEARREIGGETAVLAVPSEPGSGPDQSASLPTPPQPR